MISYDNEDLAYWHFKQASSHIYKITNFIPVSVNWQYFSLCTGSNYFINISDKLI